MARILPHIAAELLNTPLLVDGAYLEVVLTALHDRLDIEPIVSQATLQTNHRPARSSYMDLESRIAVIPIIGGLTHRAGYEPASGATGYTGIQSEILGLVKEGARGFVLDMDTPGGAVSGIIETSDFLKKLSASFPVYAVANDLMASAGYWIGATATRVYGSPLATIGSIGVTTSHIDRSEQLKKAGVVVTHISAGARKTDGSPAGPLSAEALAGIQARINTIYDSFVDHVASQRGIDPKAVRDTEAGMFSAEQARELGLIDGVATLSDTIDAMKTRLRSPQFNVGSFPSTTHAGATAAMAENLIFSQSDLDAAVAKAVADFKAASTATTVSAVQTAVGETTAAITAALTGLFGTDARAASFVELMQDGMSPDKAAKHASKIGATAPLATAPAPDVAALAAAAMAANAPRVPTGEPPAPPAAAAPEASIAEKSAAFLASIGLKPGSKIQSTVATGALTGRIG